MNEVKGIQTNETSILKLSRDMEDNTLAGLVALDQLWVKRLGSDYSNLAWGRDHFLMDLKGKWELSHCVVSKSGEKVVGFWIASSTVTGICHTHRVAVDPDYLGLGVAQRMFECLKKKCAAQGIRRMTLEVGLKNERAVGFYMNLGFHKIERQGIETYLALRQRSAKIEEDRIEEADGSCFYILEMNL